MNKCNEEFLRKNEIVIEDICSRVDSRIYSCEDVNHIIGNHGFQTDSEKEMVSIADIVGYDANERGINNKNIFLSLDNFFGEVGDGYHTRSLGLLEYDRDNIVEKLKQSFKDEPISLLETGEGTYTILSNGLHRYTILRIFYLSEAAKANGNKEKLAKLAEKYTIPAEITGIDLDKTYCKYLLKKIKDEDNNMKVIDVKTEYDPYGKKTGNAIVVYANGQKESLDNRMLLELTKERVYEDETFKENYPSLQKDYNKYTSFALFIQEEFENIIQLEENNLDEKGKNKND